MSGAERSRRFSDTTGALTWNYCSANLHPDRCVCQDKEKGRNAGTPHKHYGEAPFACARCNCAGYRAAVPDGPPSAVETIVANLRGRTPTQTDGRSG